MERIAATPTTEYINTEKWNSEKYRMECPFCGRVLTRRTNGAIGRDKMVWYDDCYCKGAEAARKHNSLVETNRADA